MGRLGKLLRFLSIRSVSNNPIFVGMIANKAPFTPIIMSPTEGKKEYNIISPNPTSQYSNAF
jgi:hypothetical protein